MNKWTKKQLEELDNITFAIAILNERRQSTTNPYSLLNQKISSAIGDLEKIKQEKRRLIETIVEIKVAKIKASIPQGNCPYAYYTIKGKRQEDIPCGEISCDDCQWDFYENLEDVIRKELNEEYGNAM